MEDDPSQANPLAIAQDWNKELSNVRLADKLSIHTEEIEFDAGAYWFHHDVENRGFFSPDFREGIEQFYSDNFGGNLNFVSRHELFGRRNILTIGLSPQYEDEPTQNYENIFGHTGARLRAASAFRLMFQPISRTSFISHRDYRSLPERRRFSRSVISRMSSSRTKQEINQIGKIFGDLTPSWARFTKSIAQHRHL
jgi:hypothetical protein